MAKKFYLKERHNPQFSKQYYIKEGQLTKKDAHKKEQSIYGFNCLIPYDTEEDYNKEISKLISDGFTVN